LLEKGSFSLVLLDVNLPDGNGFDFLPYIKKKYGVPVIMLTANDFESVVVAFRAFAYMVFRNKSIVERFRESE